MTRSDMYVHTVSRYQTKTGISSDKESGATVSTVVLRCYSATPGQFSVLTLPQCQCSVGTGAGPGHVLTNPSLLH